MQAAVGQNSVVIQIQEKDGSSRQNVLDDVPVDIGQSTVDTVVSDSQPFVVDPQQVQDRGVNVVDLCRVFAIERLVAPLVGWSVRDATLNTAAT